jgi:paraquat-inducible protein B
MGSALKGKAKTIETRQDTSPWAAQQPYLTDLFKRAQSLYGQNQTGTTPQVTAAQNAIYNRGMAGSPLTQAAQAENLKTIQGGYADPYARGVMDDATSMARAKINQQFGGDNFGSSAHQEWLGRGITAAALPFASQSYENERNRQMAATAQAPGLAGQDLSDLSQALNVSRMAEASPWEALQRYQGAVGGQYGQQSVGTQPYFQPSPLANIAGLGLAAGGLGWKPFG